MQKRLYNLYRLILSDKNTRNLFFFLLINFCFAFVELFYGLWSNSLGLISDSFHMFFDCSALLLGLAASLVTKWRPNEKFTYGFGRAEILAGLANGLFLLFIAFFIMKEAIERTFEPPEVHHERLFIISVLGFLVNLIGIFVFQHGGQCNHSHSSSSCSSHTHNNTHNNNHHNHNHHHHHHSDHGGSSNKSHFHELDHHNHHYDSSNHNHHHHHHQDHGERNLAGPGGQPAVANNTCDTKHSLGGGIVSLDMNGYNQAHETHQNQSVVGYDYNSSAGYIVSGGHDSEPLILDPPAAARTQQRGQIMQSVFLHIVADTLGSIGVMISALLMNNFGWLIADPICSIFIAILISISVYPLLRDSFYVLMQRVPVELDDKLADCFQRIKRLAGVISVHEAHFWTLYNDNYVGCLKLEVDQRIADQRFIMQQTRALMNQIGVGQLHIQIDLV